MKATQATILLIFLDVIHYTKSFRVRDYDYDCGESTNTALYTCLKTIDAASNEIDPDYFTKEEIKKFCKAVHKTDDCVHAAIEECVDELYDDDDYKYFAEALTKAKTQCSDQDNTIKSIRRYNVVE